MAMLVTALSACVFQLVPAAAAGEPEAPAPAWPAPTPPTTAAPAPEPAPGASSPVAAPPVAAAPAAAPPNAPQAPDETQQSWDAAGRLVSSLRWQGGQVVEQSTWQYDAAGRPTQQVTTTPAGTRTRTWAYDADGHVISEAEYEGTAPRWTLGRTWSDGRVSAERRVEGGVVTVTEYRYDARGQEIERVVKDGAGAPLTRLVASRAEAPPPPPEKTPIVAALSVGYGLNTDVRQSDWNLGFSVTRKPGKEVYGGDPLEVRASGSWARSRSQGVTTNDDLNIFFGMDYNYLLPRTTPFLFADVERNPVANLDIDLMLAPVGVKYDFLTADAPVLDLSFAPIWNYRSIFVPADGTCDDVTVGADTHCTYSLIRGSLRARAGYAAKTWKISDTFEYLPLLDGPGELDGTWFTEHAVLRNTALFEVKLASWLTWSESFKLTKDELFKDQVDCTADPDNLLCDGLSMQNTTSLSFSYSFAR